jgi:hypothetical protein
LFDVCDVLLAVWVMDHRGLVSLHFARAFCFTACHFALSDFTFTIGLKSGLEGRSLDLIGLLLGGDVSLWDWWWGGGGDVGWSMVGLDGSCGDASTLYQSSPLLSTLEIAVHPEWGYTRLVINLPVRAKECSAPVNHIWLVQSTAAAFFSADEFFKRGAALRGPTTFFLPLGGGVQG